jgi:teichuronic acid biosynthesis glycosyltransferase TuaG
MPEPLISVIVTTYNRKQLLSRAIDSILAQSHQGFELIVVDNYSNYDFMSYINSYGDNRIKAFQNQNGGIIAVNRNYGIRVAKGEYVAFCDDDDEWLPKKLEVVNKCIHENPECILFSHHETMVKNGSVIKTLKHGTKNVDVYRALLFKGNVLSTSAITVNRLKALQENGFNESREFLSAEDYDFWLRLSKIGKFYFLEEVLGKYNIFNGNVSGNIRLHSEASFAVKSKHLSLWLVDFPEETRKVTKALSKAWGRKALTFFRIKDYTDSSIFAYTSIRMNSLNIKSWIILVLSSLRNVFKL